MQQYLGPKRRLLSRYEGEYGFQKDGRVNFLEDRAIYVQQSFEVTQEQIARSPYAIADYWFEESEEKMIAPAHGDPTFFNLPHTFDRFSLQKTFENVTFRPNQSFNHLSIDHRAEMRMAPFLSGDTVFKNVTRSPAVELETTGFITTSADVQMGAYGRHYFGFTHTATVNPMIGHAGDAPFSNVLGNNAGADSPHVSPTVFGVLPRDMPPQELNPSGSVQLGDMGGGGRMYWALNDVTQKFELAPFKLLVPMNLVTPVGAYTDQILEFQTPRLFTDTLGSRLNDGLWFFPDDASHYMHLPGETVVGGVIQEERNMFNFHKVKLGRVNTRQDGTGELEDLFWFVPKFRIVNGNLMGSDAHPRRLVAGAKNLTGRSVADVAYLQYNTVPVATLGAATAAAAVLSKDRQALFWGDFFMRKYQVNWTLVHVATLHEHALAAAGGNDHHYLTFEVPDVDTPFGEQVTALIAEIKALVVDNRRAVNVLTPAHHIVDFILAGNPNDPSLDGFMRLNLDNLNTWRHANGLVFGHADALTAAETVQLWEGTLVGAAARTVQMDEDSYEVNPFGFLRDEDGAADAVNQVLPLAGNAAAILLAQQASTKSFYWRSQVNFVNKAAVGGNPGQSIAFPAVGNAFWGGDTRLYLPVKVPFENTIYGVTKEIVTCVEPFFGYTSATNSLACKEPLNTVRLGGQYPPLVQDYKYQFGRNWSKMFTEGFRANSGAKIIITPTTGLTFTTISEQDEFKQGTKEVSQVGEVTHTIQRFYADYVIHGTPEIEIETRQGMFEYLFLHCDIDPDRSSDEAYWPSTQPVITSFQYKIQGRENLFVRELDIYDIERLSRENCHPLSDWRSHHDAGRGILISLGQLGLTEEFAFPRAARIKLTLRLLLTKEPAPKDVGPYSSFDILQDYSTVPRRFTACLIRANQLFKGDIRGTRFEYLNEQVQ